MNRRGFFGRLSGSLAALALLKKQPEVQKEPQESRMSIQIYQCGTSNRGLVYFLSSDGNQYVVKNGITARVTA